MIAIHRTAFRRRAWATTQSSIRQLTASTIRKKDARLTDNGRVIEDDFAALREDYQAPKNPIILAHGLLGFDELRVPGLPGLPGVHYWRGISEALAAKGVEVITAAVPPSGRIEVRAQRLAESIERKAGEKSVNIIAYAFNSRILIADWLTVQQT